MEREEGKARDTMSVRKKQRCGPYTIKGGGGGEDLCRIRFESAEEGTIRKNGEVEEDGTCSWRIMVA
jgi:hypothetical protein